MDLQAGDQRAVGSPRAVPRGSAVFRYTAARWRREGSPGREVLPGIRGLIVMGRMREGDTTFPGTGRRWDGCRITADRSGRITRTTAETAIIITIARCTGTAEFTRGTRGCIRGRSLLATSIRGCLR